jgi:hypothetical protein
MAKTKISEFDSVPANNTDIDSINIAEGCAPSGINNAIRELMSQLKNQQTGADGDNFTVGGNLVVTGTSVHTGATTFTGAVVMSSALPVASGGTGASTAGNARTNLSAAASGANSDITSITGLTTALTVAQGGTGAATHTSKGVLIGNGTSAVTTVSPSTSGNVLTSDGTAWVSGSGFLKAITRVSVLTSSSSGALSSTVSTTTFGGITPAYVLYFVSAYFSGTISDLRSYLVCFGSSFDSDNLLLGHGDDTDSNPTGTFADSTMVLLPYTESQQFHVTLTGSTGAPTLKVWAVGYQT